MALNATYGPWWEDTITVYNKYQDPITNLITWHRHVIHDCFWKYEYDKVLINETVIKSYKIVCRIPIQPNFKEKYEWVKLPNDEMDEYFTLGVNDIIFRGEVEEEIDEYTKEKRSTDFIEKYKSLQGCMTVESFAINTGLGRCCEHYHVEGV